MPKIVDLTLELKPGQRGVESEPTFTLDKDGWNASTWHLYSHAGTHMDAPIHFGVGTSTIETIPLETCISPAWLVDLHPCRPRQKIHISDLGSLADSFPSGHSLVIRSGWSQYVHDSATYRDALPGISQELAHWCVERKVKILGVEPPSVADVNNIDEVSGIHRILLGGGVTIVEGLSNLDQLRDSPFTLFTIPLKLAGADGSPVRAFAIIDLEPPTFDR